MHWLAALLAVFELLSITLCRTGIPRLADANQLAS